MPKEDIDKIIWAFEILSARGYIPVNGGKVYDGEAWRLAVCIISEAWDSGMINIQNPV